MCAHTGYERHAYNAILIAAALFISVWWGYDEQRLKSVTLEEKG